MYQFLNVKHEERFKELCKRGGVYGGGRNIERRILFFVIAGNDLLYKNVDSIYDFEEEVIKLEVYDEEFLTGGTRRMIDLAFSLYGYGKCDVRQLFSRLDYENSVLALEAIRSRFTILFYPDYHGAGL